MPQVAVTERFSVLKEGESQVAVTERFSVLREGESQAGFWVVPAAPLRLYLLALRPRP